MAKDTIKEFLVSVGFDVNDAQLKKFKASIGVTEESVSSVGASLDSTAKKAENSSTSIMGMLPGWGKLAAAAVAAIAALDGVGHKLDSIYFMGKRVGSTVDDIRAFGYAAEQTGSSADAANSSLENMAEFIRSNPSSGGFFAQLGVQINDANGKLRSTTDTMDDFKKALKGMDYSRSKQYAAIVGMGNSVLLSVYDEKFDAFQAQHKAISKAAGLSQESVETNHKFRETERSAADAAKTTAYKGATLEAAAGEKIVDVAKVVAKEAKIFVENMALGGAQPKDTPQPKGSWFDNLFKNLSGAPQNSGGSAVVKSLIAKGESGNAGYNAFNRGKSGAAGHGAIDFSNMTIAEVMRRQHLPKNGPENLFAVGRYQGIPDTVAAWIKHNKQNTGDKFNAKSQDKFYEYLTHVKRPDIAKAIEQRGSLEKAAFAASQEWASVAAPAGYPTQKNGISDGTMSYYGNVGINRNKALIPAEEYMTSLKVARANFEATQGNQDTAMLSHKAAGNVTINQTTTINTTGSSNPEAHAKAIASHQNGINQTMARNATTKVH